MGVTLHKVCAGHYWTDGGAMLGVLPWAIWHRQTEVDERRRKQLALNLLLIRAEGRVILADTGLGNRLSEKHRDIYRSSEFLLPVSLAELGIRDKDVTDVILTHLHFDHAGGIVSGFSDGGRLTFPKARHWIQTAEWQMARNPDGLNQAAYNFPHQLGLLEEKAKYELVDGEAEIAPGIRLVKVGGHTVGSQIIEIDCDAGFFIYAGDIVPTLFHTSMSITSAYDVCRKDTFRAKQYVYQRLKERQGTLLLNHDQEHWEIPAANLKT